jgi:hypothetical protein
MICETCRKKNHATCRNGTWCDCQHRVNPYEAAEELTVLAQEMRTETDCCVPGCSGNYPDCPSA